MLLGTIRRGFREYSIVEAAGAPPIEDGDGGGVAFATMYSAVSFLEECLSDPGNVLVLRDCVIQSLSLYNASVMDNRQVITIIAHGLLTGSLFVIEQPPLNVPAGVAGQVAEQERGVQGTASGAAAKRWLRIRLVDLDDKPVRDADYELLRDGSSARRGRLDEAGAAKETGLTSGRYAVRFPRYDTRLYRPKTGKRGAGAVLDSVNRFILSARAVEVIPSRYIPYSTSDGSNPNLAFKVELPDKVEKLEKLTIAGEPRKEGDEHFYYDGVLFFEVGEADRPRHTGELLASTNGGAVLYRFVLPAVNSPADAMASVKKQIGNVLELGQSALKRHPAKDDAAEQTFRLGLSSNARHRMYRILGAIEDQLSSDEEYADFYQAQESLPRIEYRL